MKFSGTRVRGIRTPIIKTGDNLEEIVVSSIERAANEDNIKFNDKDVVAITEAVVSISQGNYASIQDIANDVKEKFPSGTVGLVFPIMSRNRFSLLLKGISMGVEKLVIQLSYPGDEMGNKLISQYDIFEKDINPTNDVFTMDEFQKIFPNPVHEFTGVNYLEFYKSLCACPVEIILANKVETILNYTDQVIVGSVHNRKIDKMILNKCGAKKVIGLDDIMNKPGTLGGYNDKYGILGSNMSTDDRVKLFPRDCTDFVNSVKSKLLSKFGKNIEVMVYGDGAFKDPQGGIWELADPVVSPGFTEGLKGTPNELKLKYISDNKLADLKGEELAKAMKDLIKAKDANLKGKNETLGTTPRQITDLLGSLSDLTSGSGDKGTPVILIQDYFKNYSDDE
ncbi:MAG: coenzyme F420-0:L-glutamate ligase [Bacilli bacterium]|nr:coenzyme F420-0:L-glutamate ligase [Bacilli bacterium]